jgi:ribosomal protein S18 acetylase RimI-like enzyme
MSFDRALLQDIEQAAVRGWPALESIAVDGWLWRFTSGGSIRANSVAALRFSGTDVETAIARCEALYRTRAAPAVVTVSDVSAPDDLDLRLAARGYLRGDDHVTLAKPVADGATTPLGVTVGRQPASGWMAAYLSGLSQDRRGIAPRLVAGLPQERTVFVAAEADGQVASSGLTVIDGQVASVQCMATRPEFRRRGRAGAVLGAIEAVAAAHGARWLYLQTSGDNHAAIALYGRVGFTVAGRYHTRTRHVAVTSLHTNASRRQTKNESL